MLKPQPRGDLSHSTHPQIAVAREHGWLRRVWALCLGRPKLMILSRAMCHRLVLELKGVPRRFIEQSIGLQLIQLTGLNSLGYAWRLYGHQVEVWFWNEGAPPPSTVECPTFQPGERPCPEMLLRPLLPDGLSLVSCQSGFEAISQSQGRIQRTRWFASMPDDAGWRQFVRDSGMDPAQHPAPTPIALARADRPSRNWSIHTSILKPVSRKIQGVVVGAVLAGSVCSLLLSYSVNVYQQVNKVRQELAILTSKYASAVMLQQQISAQRSQLSMIAVSQPKVLQIRVMSRLAAAGLFDETARTSLQGWEFRSNRVRLDFAVPAENFQLGQFLESVEKLGLFKEVRLLSDTSALVVSLQAELIGDSGPVQQEAAP